jgi:hypothetical protein
VADGAARTRSALARRDGSVRALVPLIWRHAARLEQAHPERLATDPDLATRALTAVARLYEVDAVTVFADGRLLMDAEGGSFSRDSDLPSPESIATHPLLLGAVEVTRRLRRVLAGSAAVVGVVAGPGSLAHQVGRPEAQAWAAAVIQTAFRAFGADQPDAWLVLRDGRGASPVDGRVATLADHFGVPLVTPEAEDGVVRLDQTTLDPTDADAIPDATWLVTTRGEVPPDADPGRVRSWLAGLGASAAIGGAA